VVKVKGDMIVKNMRIYLAALLIAVTSVNIAGCATVAGASDFMDGITSNNISGKPVDSTFTANMADFSIALFQESITDGENSLISPLSAMLALAMTTNGAVGETLVEMEMLLGGGIPIETLNEYLYSYTNGLPSHENAKLSIANSIWFRDDGSLQVVPEFLQLNADYYLAQVYGAAFDGGTARDINAWVNVKTDGMIDSIIDSTVDRIRSVMFLINAVAFDAEWLNIYDKTAIREGEFTNINRKKQKVDFMNSLEGAFISDDMATGFIKPYAGHSYSFVALLPNEDISIEAYIESLTGSGFLDILESKQPIEVHASMPKFEYEYEISMIDALEALGMHEAFDSARADFTGLATSSNGNIFIDEVLHKTFISVDERGTRAGAVTSVSLSDGAPPEEPIVVRLDRPFVFAIVDDATNLPMFIGTMLTL